MLRFNNPRLLLGTRSFTRTFAGSRATWLFKKQRNSVETDKIIPPAVATTPSTAPPPPPPSSKILKRIPKFLQPYTTQFVNAPFSHVTAFLILHELTAIVPLVGIWYILHKYHITIPLDLPTWAIDKGTKIIDTSLKNFDFTNFTFNDKFNFIMEGAYSYVIVKFLLPVRLMFSLSLMPWFAKVFVLPITGSFKKKKNKTPVNQENVMKLKKVDKPRL